MEKRFIEIPSGMIVNPDVKLFIQDPENSYHVGQRFRRSTAPGTYILAKIGPFDCVLINMESGNRWSQPCKVKDSSYITREEFTELCGENHIFNLIS